MEKFNSLTFASYREFYSMQELVNSMRTNYKVWSWGAHSWLNKGNKVLTFKVNGHHHKGTVAIAVNGSDLFDIWLVSTQGNIKKSITDVYIEDLIDTIDVAVEKIDEYVR